VLGSCLLLALLASLAVGENAPVSAIGAVRVPAVPAGHPRVYVRTNDLPGIRAKLTMPEFARAWARVQRGAATNTIAEAGPLCNAFIYLVQGDRAQGRRAIESALAGLKASTNATEAGRTLLVPIHWAACVYDWCFDLLTADEKAAFVAEFQRIAGLHSPGYPARDRCLAVVGHDSEGWVLTGQLPAGVAIYDESPEMYNAAAALFFTKFVPVRNYHYASHSHHQGDSYGTRLVYDLSAAWLFRRMGAGDVFSRELQYVPYHWIYHLRPDGEQIRRGDSFNTGRSGRKVGSMIMAGAYYEDPVLLGMADGEYFLRQCSPLEEVFELLFRPPGITARPMSQLPAVKFFPEPMGEMAARSGWAMGADSRDVLVHMRIGGTFFGNHQKRDMGTFQIYYRTPLAVASGSYEAGYGTPHWRYAHETLAGNGLLIFDPDEQPLKRQLNAGGQVIPNNGQDHPRDLETLLEKGYRQGRVTAHAFGPDPQRPEYAFIAGDITAAYGPKAERVTRSMATLFTGDARYPAVLVLFDRVNAAKETFKKTWLLHSFEEPVLAGDGATIVGAGSAAPGGQLHIRPLLPEGAVIRKVGGPGKEFWVDSVATNYAIPETAKPPVEAGAWRVEIAPGRPQREDEFLTVLTVMEAGTPAPAAVRIDGSNVVGVAFLNRAVLFARGDQPVTRVSFAVDRAAEGPILVCNVAPGTWRVERDGREQAARLAVPVEAGCLCLSGTAGKYILERVADSNEQRKDKKDNETN
jgi:heparin/heparan-sulfate lyase